MKGGREGGREDNILFVDTMSLYGCRVHLLLLIWLSVQCCTGRKLM